MFTSDVLSVTESIFMKHYVNANICCPIGFMLPFVVFLFFISILQAEC